MEKFKDGDKVFIDPIGWKSFPFVPKSYGTVLDIYYGNEYTEICVRWKDEPTLVGDNETIHSDAELINISRLHRLKKLERILK